MSIKEYPLLVRHQIAGAMARGPGGTYIDLDLVSEYLPASAWLEVSLI